MSRPSNSEIERHYFEYFRKAYPLPDGEICYEDKPDVIVRGRSTLGVEITNLYITPGSDPASEQVQRRRREKVLQCAQDAFLAAGGKKFELSVDFDPRKPIEEIAPLAEALYALANELTGSETGKVSPLLFKHIDALRLVYLNAKEYPDPKWKVIQGFSVPMLSVERLREVVAEKAARLASYQPCDRYWLLVIVDFMDSAQDQELYWPESKSLEGCPYEKVLLYKPQFGEVLEVPRGP